MSKSRNKQGRHPLLALILVLVVLLLLALPWLYLRFADLCLFEHRPELSEL